MDKMTVNCEIELNEELWVSYQDLCEQSGANPVSEIGQAVEEYIASVREENEV